MSFGFIEQASCAQRTCEAPSLQLASSRSRSYGHAVAASTRRAELDRFGGKHSSR